MANWPWVAEATLFGETISDQCGSYTITIVEAGTTTVPSYITFDPVTGLMTLAPTIDDPNGTINLEFIVSLTDYPAVKIS